MYFNNILIITILYQVHQVLTVLKSFKFANENVLQFDEISNYTISDNKPAVWKGFRLDVDINIIRNLCLLKPYNTLDTNQLNFIFMTKTQNLSIPLNNLNALINHLEFVKEKKITILVTGWLTNLRLYANPGADKLYKAYSTREDINFIVFDTWDYLDTLYSWAAFRTVDLGIALGNALVTLNNYLPKSEFHLLGYSLGAHIVAEAGRTFNRETGKQVARITGLDPAKPCFEKDDWLSGLQQGDSKFIDVIHSNSALVGQLDPCGDADFYPNGVIPLQPGCTTFSCSHLRAVDLYAQTVYKDNGNIFISKQCYSLSKLNHDNCIMKNISMGYAVPLTAKGLFYLETSGTSPFTL